MTRERRLLIAALGAWIVVEILLLVTAPYLGHDEAQYATAARGDRQWLYVSPGTVTIARIGLLLGASDVAMRIAPAILSCGFIAATWWAGRVAFGARAGAAAAAVVATAHPLALRSTELLSDFPSAACMLAGIALLVRELDREGGPSWWVVAVAPAFAAAFYIRYGHGPVIAIAAAATAVLWWRSVLARPLRVIATLAVFAALLVPFARHSLRETGSVYGLLGFYQQITNTGRTGNGLVDYVTSNPFKLYGLLVTPVLLAGLVAVVRPGPRWRPAVCFAVIAIGQFVIVGVTGTAQPRYVCVASALLVCVGIDGILRFASGRPKLAWPALGVLAAAWLYVAIMAVPVNHGRTRKLAALDAAARAIIDDAAGKPCLVAGTELTLLMWETKCQAQWAKNPPFFTWDPALRHYVVSQQPDDVVDVAGIATAQNERPVEMPLPRGNVRLWHLVPP